ncbi:MAG: hypothetical protein ACK4GW_01175 [Pseudorhodobacter sp.]
MTALKKYRKLECTGLWRADPLGQRREVIVNLGDSSLVLSDPKQETALSHWSLPAVIRRNPDKLPAIFAPGLEDGEELEIEDPEMIAALRTVHSALESARPHPGRLRNGILGTMAAGIVLLGVVFLPEALATHTASVLPDATRVEIGRLALADMSRLTGQPCAGRRGTQALSRLALRLADPAPRIVVLREGLAHPIHLPGPVVALPQSLLAEQDGPDMAAGFALAETLAARIADPMLPILRHAGSVATLRLLTSGVLPPDAISGYAEKRISAPTAHPPVSLLLAGFEAAGIASTPYAQGMAASGDRLRDLIDSDPFEGVAPPPLMTDEDWVSLQDICSG